MADRKNFFPSFCDLALRQFERATQNFLKPIYLHEAGQLHFQFHPQGAQGDSTHSSYANTPPRVETFTLLFSSQWTFTSRDTSSVKFIIQETLCNNLPESSHAALAPPNDADILSYPPNETLHFGELGRPSCRRRRLQRCYKGIHSLSEVT